MRPVTGEPRFSIGIAVLTWFLSLTAAYVLTFAVLAATGHLGEKASEFPAWVTPVTVSALWIPVLAGLRIVSNTYGTRRLRDDYGLRFRKVDLLGIPIGVLSQLVLVELVYWPLRSGLPETFGRKKVEAPAHDLFDRASGSWKIVLILIVVVGAPLVEELLYRGLILRSLDGRIHDIVALVISAAWFALAHLQAVQLPGLFVFGLVLGYCAQRTRRLGMGLFAHAAFNATTVAILLAQIMPTGVLRMAVLR